MIKQYLLDSELRDQEKKARELTLSRAQYEVIDSVLYHIEPDKTLRIVPPTVDQKGLFKVVWAPHDGLLLFPPASGQPSMQIDPWLEIPLAILLDNQQIQ